MIKIQKWGNGLGVRLPKVVFESGIFSEGSEVAVHQNGSEITIRVVKKKSPTLAGVLKGLKPGNFHPLIDWGEDVGNEIIR